MYIAGEQREDALLDMIDVLDDEGLRAVVARAQARLLDRPVPPSELPALTVEVVGRDEERLLACYRSLAPQARERARRELAAAAARTWVSGHADTPWRLRRRGAGAAAFGAPSSSSPHEQRDNK